MGRPRIWAVDLFCGAGGLSYGLQQAGISVTAGIDIDESCRYPFESNIEAAFLQADVRALSADTVNRLWAGFEGYRLLAGCAPCQPFSPYRRGADTSNDERWPLLDEFTRLVTETRPHLVTMENVPRLAGTSVFDRLIDTLTANEYQVDVRSCYGPRYGLPQERRRLVLIASRLGEIRVPGGSDDAAAGATVRSAIEKLRPIEAGASNEDDSLHISRALSQLNMRRIRASRPGGSWADWPVALRSPCHRKSTGSSFKNVYARMEWDRPSPTITTLAHNFGTGRFGHPEQDRPISLREAAILQGFPPSYRFAKRGSPVHFSRMGRMIGNAVPPPLGRAIGMALVEHVAEVSALP